MQEGRSPRQVKDRALSPFQPALSYFKMLAIRLRISFGRVKKVVGSMEAKVIETGPRPTIQRPTPRETRDYVINFIRSVLEWRGQGAGTREPSLVHNIVIYLLL